MLRYDVFTQARDGVLHYGSRRLGVPATSTALGGGPREVALIVDAHDLIPGSLIYLNNAWIRVLGVDTSELMGWPCEVDYDYLPPYSDPEITFGGEEWSPLLAQRLIKESISMTAIGDLVKNRE